MKKALIVTHVSGFVPQFEMNNVKILQNMGYEVHYASNYNNPSYGKDNSLLDGTGIIQHQIDFARSPYSKQTFIAYKQMKKLMSDIHFDLVHCHTPMGGAVARLAAHKTNTSPVIYTAHGFHFYKGAPIQNILIYKTMEKWLAHYTDALITINQEDYKAAQRFQLKQNGKVFYIPGVGIDVEKYKNVTVDRNAKRRELGVPEDAFVLLSVGELIPRKNHKVVIEAIAKLSDEKIQYLICGQGKLKDELNRMICNLGLEKQVHLLGFRRDIAEICKASDLFVFPSLQEGLPVALMEAMACGMPVICSNIRGNTDLVEDGVNGFLVDPQTEKQLVNKLKKLKQQSLNSMKKANFNKIENFDIRLVEKKMKNIYESIL